MRYAQAKPGQKLHLVVETDPYFTGDIVSQTALCGKHGPWRRTFNVPLGLACKRCLRILKRMQNGGRP